MMIKKLLLFSLLTFCSGLALTAQNLVHVHGTVTNDNGDAQENVNILVTAFFADSSAFFESVYTGMEGDYTVDIETLGLGIFGIVEVSMVDCWNTIVSHFFLILNGNEVFQADFVYCDEVVVDSCVMFILQEWDPGAIITLTAWTPPSTFPEYIWSTGETTQTITPQTSGEYCVTATFPGGCSMTDCIFVNLDSTAFCFTFIVSEPNNEGSYDLEAVASGPGPYTYAWSTGDTTSVITHVQSGTYCVIVTDATGCVSGNCIIVDGVSFCEVYISEEPGGILTAYGYGVPEISYVWNTTDSAQSITPAEPGLYCVTMTDANDCSTYSCYYFGLFPDSCSVFVGAYLADSNVLILQAFPFTQAETWGYLWNTGETTESISVTDPSQTYCVTMTDSNGCSAAACFESSYWCYAWIDLQYHSPELATLSANTDPIFNLPGSTLVSYQWDTGDTTHQIQVTESGDYCVTVTIGDNCETVACMNVDFENLGTDCYVWILQYPDSTGQWLAEAWTWGWGNFSFNWSNGDTNSVTQLAGPNEFICVTVTSSFGCVAEACLDTFPGPCQSFISTFYSSNESAILTASFWGDPSQLVQYSWSTGEDGQVITVSESGTYCVTVTGGGCTSTSCVEVYFWNIDSCGVWISTYFEGSVTVYTANAWGTAPYTYAWSNGGTEQSQYIDFGIHELCVTVTDATGCASVACNFQTDSCSIYLTYSPEPVHTVSIVSNDPIAYVVWSTGDTLTTIVITAPGEYCAYVTTVFGCVSTACITIDSLGPHNGLNGINGFVLAGQLQGLTGTVHAYRFNPSTGLAFTSAGSSAIGTDGYYAINGLQDGLYVVKAELTAGTTGAEQFIPGYHHASVHWETATVHQLPYMLPVTTDVHLTQVTDLDGSGVIGGIVTDPNGILSDEETEGRELGGLANVVVLLRTPQGQPLQYAYTLADGSFRFPDLPFGTYRLGFDIPGLTSPDVWVTLTPENPERLQITLVVNSGTVSLDDLQPEQVFLYPNPASHEINIQVPGHHTSYDIRIVDMQGQIVYAGSTRPIGGNLTVGVGHFTPGLYHLHLVGGNELYYGRFVKHD